MLVPFVPAPTQGTATSIGNCIAASASASGDVRVVASGDLRQLQVDADGLGTPPVNDYYEVWLLDPRTSQMLPMGILSPTGIGKYTTTKGIMSGYSAVDISLQSNDGNPAHSATSLLRAQLS